MNDYDARLRSLNFIHGQERMNKGFYEEYWRDQSGRCVNNAFGQIEERHKEQLICYCNRLEKINEA